MNVKERVTRYNALKLESSLSQSSVIDRANLCIHYLDLSAISKDSISSLLMSLLIVYSYSRACRFSNPQIQRAKHYKTKEMIVCYLATTFNCSLAVGRCPINSTWLLEKAIIKVIRRIFGEYLPPDISVVSVRWASKIVRSVPDNVSSNILIWGFCSSVPAFLEVFRAVSEIRVAYCSTSKRFKDISSLRL